MDYKILSEEHRVDDFRGGKFMEIEFAKEVKIHGVIGKKWYVSEAYTLDHGPETMTQCIDSKIWLNDLVLRYMSCEDLIDEMIKNIGTEDPYGDDYDDEHYDDYDNEF